MSKPDMGYSIKQVWPTKSSFYIWRCRSLSLSLCTLTILYTLLFYLYHDDYHYLEWHIPSSWIDAWIVCVSEKHRYHKYIMCHSSSEYLPILHYRPTYWFGCYNEYSNSNILLDPYIYLWLWLNLPLSHSNLVHYNWSVMTHVNWITCICWKQVYYDRYFHIWNIQLKECWMCVLCVWKCAIWVEIKTWYFEMGKKDVNGWQERRFLNNAKERWRIFTSSRLVQHDWSIVKMLIHESIITR